MVAVGAISGKCPAGRFKVGKCSNNHLLFTLSDHYKRKHREGLFSYSRKETERVLDLYISAIFRSPGSSEHFTIFSEDLSTEDTSFLHVASVYFANNA